MPWMDLKTTLSMKTKMMMSPRATLTLMTLTASVTVMMTMYTEEDFRQLFADLDSDADSDFEGFDM